MGRSHSTLFQFPLPIDDFVIELPLTHGLVTFIDAVDADLGANNWHAKPRRASYVAARSINPRGEKQTLLLHRVILGRMLGRELTKDEEVDHVDLDPLNNTRKNLRLATATQNNYNKIPMPNKHGYPGIHFHKGCRSRPWQAVVWHQKKSHSAGYFATPEEAYEAYCSKLKELAGEFARFE